MWEYSVGDLCKKVDIHQKKLERLFISYVGVTPKKFCKIVRFYDTHKILSKNAIENLSQTDVYFVQYLAILILL